MLQQLKSSSQGLLLKIVLACVIITFALSGISSLIINYYSNTAQVAFQINGQDITKEQLTNRINYQTNLFNKQFGEELVTQLGSDWLEQYVKNQIIDERVTGQHSSKILSASSDVIHSTIKSLPAFQDTQGDFSASALKAHLASNNITTRQFKELIHTDILSSYLRLGILDSDFVVDPETHLVANLITQIRDFLYVEIDTRKLRNGIKITKKETADYFDKNKSRYKTPEKVSIDYLVVDKQLILEHIKIDEKEIQAVYEQEVDEIASQGQGVEASHILINIDEKRDAEEALAIAEGVVDKLNANISFDSLAKEYSDDFSTASEGGSLGEVTKGLLPTEIDVVLDTMQVGEISNPILTDFGYHIVKIDKRNTVEIPSYAEKRNEILSKLSLQQATQEFNAIADILADLSYSSSDLEPLLQELQKFNVPKQTTPLFTRSAPIAPFDNQDLLAAAFSEAIIKERYNSDVIALSDKLYVLRINQHVPVAQQTLEQATEEIKSLLLARQSTQNGKEIANKVKTLLIDKNITTKEELMRLANSVNSLLDVGIQTDTSFDSQDVKTKKIFSLTKDLTDKNNLVDIVTQGNKIFVVQLTAVKQPEISTKDKEAAYANLKNARDTLFQSYVLSLREQADIKFK